MNKANAPPIVELLEFPAMLALDHFLLQRWFPPITSAVMAGAIIGSISGAFYLRGRKRIGLRFVLVLVCAVALSLLIKF